MIRALIAGVLAAALGWSGYWFIGARALDRGVDDWLAERRGEGWVAEASETSVRGFPNRFDLTLSDLHLADPETGVAWTAPFFQVLSLSYRPSHVIAVWPATQTISTPHQTVSIEGAEIRGSLRLSDLSTLGLETATIVSDEVSMSSNVGWLAELDTGRLAARLVPATTSTYEIGVEALGVTPAEGVRRAVDVSGRLPPEIETLRFDAVIAFTAPWDRAAIEVARPQPTAIDLREVRATWGNLDLRATGDLEIEPDGTPTGEIVLRAENWRELLQLAVASGAVPEGIATTLERGLAALAGASGSPETLDATLSLRGGRVFLGFIPLGSAPNLRLR